ncbi:DUF4124 domain-containing protein [Pseudomonas citronellolis]|uniref:DUF4124 domain-containing protein n=1 Tax=Pseudomonas citronellolis TaxID=53408 RepID=UPI0023E3C570|nr:DUF4124 domain-containing protein [Pseudomonas citronellolis]MDF3934283.1 DUF4124 domain-containing protein [Pseudomonas citronellolis]
MRTLCILLLAASAGAFGATMNKCDDGQGHLTFTQQACPDGSAGEQIKVVPATEGLLIAQPPPPPPPQDEEATADGEKAGKAESEQKEATQTAQAPTRQLVRVTIVGADPASDCGPYTEQQLRTLAVRKQVVAGMRAQDVTAAWGDPDTKGALGWDYAGGTSVGFDSRGCVTGTSTPFIDPDYERWRKWHDDPVRRAWRAERWRSGGWNGQHRWHQH